ncbi:MAG: IMP cyclohydrolase [Oscillospiraceae bacterium]|jgi:hypothetical protein|nr:IMP cyclohydrolase [Oscillospiraceae bacterium]
MKRDARAVLRANSYPGRGIILGRGEDNACAVAVYFIMGRSENSRNRVFEETDDGIRTRAFDPARLTDPSLVIYHPVRAADGRTIVTNGDQTDTIAAFLRDGRDFRDALRTRAFEPDGPIWTPRISGILERDGSYSLSILKSVQGDSSLCCRHFFEYDAPIPGLGHLLHTYLRDGDPVPSFEGEPIPVGIETAGGLEKYAREIWDALDPQNKVALMAREIEIASGAWRQIIINRYGGESCQSLN